MTLKEITKKIKEGDFLTQQALKNNNLADYYYWLKEVSWLLDKKRIKLKNIKKNRKQYAKAN